LADVMIGQDQAVGGDERARGAAEADGGELDVLQPVGRDREVVLGFEKGSGRHVEEPHPLVSVGGDEKRRQDEEYEQLDFELFHETS